MRKKEELELKEFTLQPAREWLARIFGRDIGGWLMHPRTGTEFVLVRSCSKGTERPVRRNALQAAWLVFNAAQLAEKRWTAFQPQDSAAG